MATVNIVLARAGVKSLNDIMPMYSNKNLKSENITSSGTSQQTTNTAERADIARIVALGGSVYVKAGPNPTAASGDILVLAGVPFDLGGLEDGDKIAVIDA